MEEYEIAGESRPSILKSDFEAFKRKKKKAVRTQGVCGASS